MPDAGLDGCLQWSHLRSGHTGANRAVDFFRECFDSGLTLTELKSRMQTIVDAYGCHASKHRDSRDRGLISSLPKPHFLPKNGEKMPFCSLKQRFWGLNGQL